ncbi:hypothetical protein KSP40_PGU002193 [Platanthera guangdongensis]|uniref:Trichome birefringence-like N-terminal domain-containing protein n=1 Tax=Platanthera guangdongensis TaxID=2320717 RepID=A0ABR2LER2_9ASPA
MGGGASGNEFWERLFEKRFHLRTVQTVTITIVTAGKRFSIRRPVLSQFLLLPQFATTARRHMARVFIPMIKLIPSIPILLTLATLILFSTFPLLFSASRSPVPPPLTNTRLTCRGSTTDLTNGFWIRDSGQENHRSPLYDASCPFHRNAWNCLCNARDNMEAINSWVWIPQGCGMLPLPRIDPAAFVTAMRGRRIGFVGDSLNENFIVAFLCTLRSADPGARKWKRKDIAFSILDILNSPFLR